MTQTAIAPYGSWKSPVTSDAIVSGSVGLGGAMRDGDYLYWSEARPSEKGRTTVVRRAADGTVADVVPQPFNVRTRAHEYGGGAWAVFDGVVYFANFADQRLYRQQVGGEPEPLTPEGDRRFADIRLDQARNRLICACEDHTVEGEAKAYIAAISLDGSQTVAVLAEGSDFHTSPTLSPDGSQLAWITWQHPHLPWDETQLWLADVTDDGSLANARQIAGAAEESILQPQRSPSGQLYFVSDSTDWWNIYRWNADGEPTALCSMDAEFGLPQWVFGMSTYGFASGDRAICAYTQEGLWTLASLDLTDSKLTPFDLPYSTLSGIFVDNICALFIGGSATAPSELVYFDFDTCKAESLKRSTELAIAEGYLSAPESIEFPTTEGTAYGLLYRPKNQDFEAPTDEKPPLKVKIHGGPTAQTSSSLSLGIQYWTSRGFAVLDVNYGGSTGYGRKYRRRLDFSWGIVDVDDCVNGAQYLVDQGIVDGDRLTIEGGSAGGYTTLAALTFKDTFKAGASRYGVSELEALARDTHKFESRYLDRLIGPYPEKKDVYEERSPLHAVDQLNCPVIFFQGLEDKIVPPNQAEMMVDALKTKGIPVAYVAFEGEQHGFRQSENIKRSLDGEFYFYSRIFGFEPAEAIAPVEIANLNT
ncbi:MAG: S9 family peptidase [Cyanobacteria bacterium P01_C01_bin.89]